MNVFAVLVCAFLGILGLINKRRKNKTKSTRGILGLEDIPQPKPSRIPWIGNVSYFWPISDSIDKTLRLCETYPGIFKGTGANKIVVALNSAATVHQLLKSTENGHNVKFALIYDMLQPFLTKSVLVSQGKSWHTHRKIITKTQSLPAMKYYMKMLNEHSKKFIHSLEDLFKDGQPHVINEQINVVFLQTICDLMTGSEQHKESDWIQLHRNFQIWEKSTTNRILNPWLIPNFIWRLHPMYRTSQTAINEMIQFARVLNTSHHGDEWEGTYVTTTKYLVMSIERHKQNLAREKIDARNYPGSDLDDMGEEQITAGRVKCMVEELIEAGVDDEQIVDEVNGILFGGHETVAAAVHFFCLCIALNPNVQEKCQEEIDELFENPEFVQDQNINYEAAQGSLKYLERCFLEVLRLFPPAYVIFRQLESEFKVDVNDETYVLPVGCNIAVPIIAIHRSSEYYPEPMKFDPDRFLPEEVAKRPACSYIPFSVGPRNCLAIRFAMLEMKLVAAHLLRNFVITSSEKMDEVPLMPYAILTPARDYLFTMKKR